MNKLKLFIENFIIYGLGGIISKIIPLIMVPIVIRLMPNTTYYGISDLSNTLVSFCSTIAIMGMYDAMYRMFFEKDDNEFKKSVCTTTIFFTFLTSLLIFIIMLLIRDWLAQYFFGDKRYSNVVYLSAIATLVGATNSILSAPTRMQNKRKIFLFTNSITPILSYAISIPLLLAGQYIIALPLATVISGITLEIIFGTLNKEWFEPRLFNFQILVQLLLIAIPLLPNFLIYWVFNSCDKVMITNIIGISSAGIYSVASKFGHCSQLIYMAFAGGWQFFAYSIMKEKHQIESNSKIFEYLGVISFVSTTFVCAWSYFIFKNLFTDKYLSGYIVAPYLFLAPLLQMLFQVACNQFLVIKKTWPNVLILLTGAIINILINYTLIPLLGIEGAAIATLIGYVVSDIICVVVLCQMKLMIISKRFIISSILMAACMVIWRYVLSYHTILGTINAIFISTLFILMYKKDIEKLIRKRDI